jgi:hypothetical protein
MRDDANRLVTVLLESSSVHARERIVGAPDQVVITSPYLTSDAAERVIGAADPKTSMILTTFRAETFASKASSLSTLRRLIEQGFNLRYLDDLHAKIILTQDACFVGSQNLTAGGTQNKEATALITDASTLAAVTNGLRAWLELSNPITLEMIGDMEREIGPLTERSKKLASAVDALDQTIRTAESIREEARDRLRAENERREEERKKQELVLQAREAYSTLQNNVSQTPIKGEVWLSLQWAAGPHWSSGLQTLMAPSNRDLTYWNGHSLTKRQRYLLIIPEIGKLGWPALNKTRLTRFGIGLRPTQSNISVKGTSWDIVDIDFNESLESLVDWNVKFTLSWAREFAKVTLLMKFTLDGLELVDIEEREGSPTPRDYFNALTSRFEIYAPWLVRELLGSFKYKSNGLGVPAKKFCDGLPEDMILRLRTHLGHPFFSLETN